MGQGARVNGNATVEGRPTGGIGDGCSTLACQVHISCGAACQIALTFSHILMYTMVAINGTTSALPHTEGTSSGAVTGPCRHGRGPIIVVESIRRGLAASNNHLPVPFIGNYPLATATSGCIPAGSNQGDCIGDDAEMNSRAQVVTADASKRHTFPTAFTTG